jgi:hypothetical protein
MLVLHNSFQYLNIRWLGLKDKLRKAAAEARSIRHIVKKAGTPACLPKSELARI